MFRKIFEYSQILRITYYFVGTNPESCSAIRRWECSSSEPSVMGGAGERALRAVLIQQQRIHIRPANKDTSAMQKQMRCASVDGPNADVPLLQAPVG